MHEQEGASYAIVILSTVLLLSFPTVTLTGIVSPGWNAAVHNENASQISLPVLLGKVTVSVIGFAEERSPPNCCESSTVF